MLLGDVRRECGVDLADHALGRGARIRGPQNRPSYDEIVGPEPNSLGRRGVPLVVVCRRTAGTYAWTDDERRERKGGPTPLDGRAGSNDAIAPGIEGRLRAPEHVRFEIVAGADRLGKIVRVAAGEEGDSELIRFSPFVRVQCCGRGAKNRLASS